MFPIPVAMSIIMGLEEAWRYDESKTSSEIVCHLKYWF